MIKQLFKNNANHDTLGGELHELHSPNYDTDLCMITVSSLCLQSLYKGDTRTWK